METLAVSGIVSEVINDPILIELKVLSKINILNPYETS
jgi:hypothetical protein